VELWQLVIAVAGGITAVLSAWGALLRTKRGRALHRWIQEGQEQDRRRVIAEVIDDVMPRYLAPIHKQLIPNGGASMRDELRNGLAHLNGRLDQTDATVARLASDLDAERELNQRGRRGDIERRQEN
jgi:hypothetical protein